MRKFSQNFCVGEGVFVEKAWSTASESAAQQALKTICRPQNRRFHLVQACVLGPSDGRGGRGGRVLEMWSTCCRDDRGPGVATGCSISPDLSWRLVYNDGGYE